MQMHEIGQDIVAPSYSVESLDSSPPASVVVEEEKKSEDDEDEFGDEELSQFIDTSFAASVRKTLSTVVEAASADEDGIDRLGGSNKVMNWQDSYEEQSSNIIEIIDVADYEEVEISEEAGTNYDSMLLEALGTSDEASPRHTVNAKSFSMPSTPTAVPSEDESVCGPDGRKEPKGNYNKDEVDVEEAVHESFDDLIEPKVFAANSNDSNDQREERYSSMEEEEENEEISKDIAISRDEEEEEEERYASLEQEETHNAVSKEASLSHNDEDVQNDAEIGQPSDEYEDEEEHQWTINVDATGSEVDEEADDESEEDDDDDDESDRSDGSDFESSAPNSYAPEENSVAQSENASVAWALRDIASEETERATGRTRKRFVVSGPKPSSKSRMIASLLSDDTSVQQSEAFSEAFTESFLPSQLDTEDVKEVENEDEDYEDSDGDDDSLHDDQEEEDAAENNAAANTGGKKEADDEHDVVSMDEGFEIMAPTSLVENEDIEIGDGKDSKSESEDLEETESDEASESDSEELEEADTEESDSQPSIALDPSGLLGRSVDSDGHEIKKPDPDAVRADDWEEETKLDCGGKTVVVREEDDAVNGAPVIHVLTDDSDDTNVTDVPAFEVGQGALSPTKVGEFVSKVEGQQARGPDQEERVRQFKKLIAPLVDGHKPSIVESACIRQAAIKANISLDLVDTFLDYVNGDSNPEVFAAGSSLDEQDALLKSFEMEDFNEDDAINDFLGRIEQTRAAAAEEAVRSKGKVAALEAAEIAAAKAIAVAEAARNKQSVKSTNSFLEQFEELQLQEESGDEPDDIRLQISTNQSQGDAIGGADTEEIEVQLPAFEVGQGPLSPTKLSEFLATVDTQPAGKGKEMEKFKQLIVPIVDGHKPSFIEVAGIRQAAMKANIPLEVVDNFLDYVNDDDYPELHVAGSSKEEQPDVQTKGWDKIAEHNDDEEIAAFLSRAAAAATSKATSPDHTSNPFLEKFNELDVHDDVEKADSDKPTQNHATKVLAQEQSTTDMPAFEVGQGPLSPTKLSQFFADIDQQPVSGEEEKQRILNFQELVLPLVNGHKPTVIEEAQIRQAAVKASVPLDLVDTFLDYVKSSHPEIGTAVSSKDEDHSMLLKSWDDIEELNEDVAIAGFLSRFSACTPTQCKQDTSDLRAEMQDETTTKAKEIETTNDTAKPVESKPVEPSKPVPSSEPVVSETTEKPKELNGSEIKLDATEDEAWWEHAGSPKSQKKDLASAVNLHYSADLDETLSTDSAEVAEKRKSRNRLSIETDFTKKNHSLEHRYDEDIWRRRTAMATYGWGWEEATWLSPRSAGKGPVGIDGVRAAEGLSNFMFNRSSFVFARKKWNRSYKQRTKGHTGYFNVDVHSLQESATFGAGDWPQDDTPWELRSVRQRFLHERSLSFSRNWFGTLEKVNGNDKIKYPVCKPKSMEMPMENIPEDGEWHPDWYTTWMARKTMPKPAPAESEPESETEVEETDAESTFDEMSDEGSEDSDGSGSSYTDSSSFIDDDEWEEAPECGKIINVKQKIGEHVTRVHHDYTSSLRRSRWRKKYFPKGTFPY